MNQNRFEHFTKRLNSMFKSKKHIHIEYVEGNDKYLGRNFKGAWVGFGSPLNDAEGIYYIANNGKVFYSIQEETFRNYHKTILLDLKQMECFPHELYSCFCNVIKQKRGMDINPVEMLFKL